MSHDHRGHGHAHGHVDLRAGARHAGRLWWSFGLIAGFMLVEAWSGWRRTR
jgi:Co/Zn/Cd efflux system component